MELRQLVTLCKINHYKSYQKAAEDLGYAQSTITTQIQLLEKELEIKLFERIGRTLKLTSEGEIFLKYAEKTVNLINESKAAISSKDIPKGMLKIGIVESLCTIILPELLESYKIQYPKVEIIIKLGTCSTLRNMLKDNKVDLIFILGETVEDSDLVSYISYNEPMALLASSTNHLSNKNDLTLEDISSEPLILTEKGCNYRTVFESLFYEKNIKPHLSLEIGSIETIKNFIIRNLGITFLPEMTAKKELIEGKLVTLNFSECQFNMSTQVLYHKNKWVTPAMNSFMLSFESWAKSKKLIFDQ